MSDLRLTTGAEVTWTTADRQTARVYVTTTPPFYRLPDGDLRQAAQGRGGYYLVQVLAPSKIPTPATLLRVRVWKMVVFRPHTDPPMQRPSHLVTNIALVDRSWLS